eukprot:TRINITY_DN1603_c0_g1_i1.p1 TRINITY_DN1603_c0_g1~~TRINITY_DN1603_c0_g1_i1.p1  ORF type:complete len:474 (+),score=20.96 TRINITY_DN1603_c0_g1_i1:221-1642(+)
MSIGRQDTSGQAASYRMRQLPLTGMDTAGLAQKVMTQSLHYARYPGFDSKVERNMGHRGQLQSGFDDVGYCGSAMMFETWSGRTALQHLPVPGKPPPARDPLTNTSIPLLRRSEESNLYSSPVAIHSGNWPPGVALLHHQLSHAQNNHLMLLDRAPLHGEFHVAAAATPQEPVPTVPMFHHQGAPHLTRWSTQPFTMDHFKVTAPLITKLAQHRSQEAEYGQPVARSLSLLSLNERQCPSPTLHDLAYAHEQPHCGNCDDDGFDYTYTSWPSSTFGCSTQLSHPRGGSHASNSDTYGDNMAGTRCGGASRPPSSQDLGHSGSTTKQHASLTPIVARTAVLHSSTVGFPGAKHDALQSCLADVYKVKLKRSTQDCAPPSNTRETFKVGDYVLIDADRGTNIGLITAVVLLKEHAVPSSSKHRINSNWPIMDGTQAVEGMPCSTRRRRSKKQAGETLCTLCTSTECSFQQVESAA